MTQYDQQRKNIADQVRRELAIESVLSPTQARAFVRGLQKSWSVPSIQWSDQESHEKLDEARSLLHVAKVYQEIEGIESTNATDCYRRAGEILEWLSRAKDDLCLVVPIELFAAAAFQLGGFPAMARGLLDQIEIVDEGTRLYSYFLKADFDNVIKSVIEFWIGNQELTGRDYFRELFVEEDETGIAWYFTVEIIRCLGLIADSLRRGDDARLSRAIEKLTALDKIATRTSSDDVSLLISLMRAVANTYQKASIYHPVLQLAARKVENTDLLKTFARDQFSRGRGILWASQMQGLDRLLQEPSFAICTPTGSGKTLVAIMALIKELILAGQDVVAPLGLYLVPSRALAGEVESKLRSELGNDLIVTGLYGGADWGITDYWLNTERPTVLISTVEKAEALMRYIGPLLLARLRILIIDEAHQVVAEDNHQTKIDFAEHSSRSLRLEGFVSRLIFHAPNIARIALTAVAGGAALPVSRWIVGRSDVEPIGVRYRSTRQMIGKLEATPRSAGRISLAMMNGQFLNIRDREEPVYIPLSRMQPMPTLPPEMRNSINRFNELHVLWTALHLIDEDYRILISIAQKPEQTMGWFKAALELPAWSVALRFSIPKDGFSRSKFLEARAVCKDYCGEDSFEFFLLDKGIATSHGQMPQRLRRLMTELIDRRICPITIATATLTEGVNLPFDIIFVMSLIRTTYNPDNPPQSRRGVIPLSVSEFRNLAGRAGRPGAVRGMEGITLIAVPIQPSTTANSIRKKQ